MLAALSAPAMIGPATPPHCCSSPLCSPCSSRSLLADSEPCKVCSHLTSGPQSRPFFLQISRYPYPHSQMFAPQLSSQAPYVPFAAPPQAPTGHILNTNTFHLLTYLYFRYVEKELLVCLASSARRCSLCISWMFPKCLDNAWHVLGSGP